MSLTYQVTGGAGFFGSHLVDEPVSRKQYVRMLDNFATRRRDNLSHVMNRIDLVEGDVRHSQGDIQKATALLGYVPRVNFEAGPGARHRVIQAPLADRYKDQRRSFWNPPT